MHQKTFNFKVYIGTGQEQIVYDAQKVTLPRFDISMNEDLVGNVAHKSSGKGSWEDIEITLYDTKEKDPTDNTSWMSNAYVAFGTLVKTKTAALVVGRNFPIGEGSTYTVDQGQGINKVPQIIIEKIYGNKTTQGYNAPDGLSQEGMVTRQQPNGEHYSEFWTIFEPVLKGVNFGDGDYSSEELNTITMIFSYSHAKLTSAI